MLYATVVANDIPQFPSHDETLLVRGESLAFGLARGASLMGEEEPVTIFQTLELLLDKTVESWTDKTTRNRAFHKTSGKDFNFVEVSIVQIKQSLWYSWGR